MSEEMWNEMGKALENMKPALVKGQTSNEETIEEPDSE